jgi:hypothetical protein
MIEYYLLPCGCVMASEKIKDREYYNHSKYKNTAL